MKSATKAHRANYAVVGVLGGTAVAMSGVTWLQWVVGGGALVTYLAMMTNYFAKRRRSR